MTATILAFPATCTFDGRHQGCTETKCECGCIGRSHGIIEIALDFAAGSRLAAQTGNVAFVHDGPCGGCDGCSKFRPEYMRSLDRRDRHADHRRMGLQNCWVVCTECGRAKLDRMVKADDPHVRRAAAQFITKRQLKGYERFMMRQGYEKHGDCDACGWTADLVQRGKFFVCQSCADTSDWTEANILADDENAADHGGATAAERGAATLDSPSAPITLFGRRTAPK